MLHVVPVNMAKLDHIFLILRGVYVDHIARLLPNTGVVPVNVTSLTFEPSETAILSADTWHIFPCVQNHADGVPPVTVVQETVNATI